MFQLNLNRIFVKDNMESPEWHDPFNILDTDKAEIDLYSFVTTPENCEALAPSLKEIKSAQGAEAIERVREAARSIAGHCPIEGIEGIRDETILTFGDIGYCVYHSDSIPDYMDWRLLAVERDEDIRRIGEIMDGILSDPKFDKTAETIISMIAGAANPVYQGAVLVGKFVLRAIASTLKKNQDDTVGVFCRTLNRSRNYPHGSGQFLGEWDTMNNIRIDFEMFAYNKA